MVLNLRRAGERGHAHHGWLDSRHSFSFAHYFDPAHMGFRNLRVINEDVIQPGTGFGQHGHRDMEILTYIVGGALEHRDSTGGHGILRRGEVQHMSAGRGVRHSEMNPSDHEPVTLLQIWILPEAEDLEPSYQQAAFPDAGKRGRLRLLAGRGGEAEDALPLAADAAVYATLLAPGERVSHALAPGRGAWVQMVAGRVMVNGTPLAAGDGAALEAVEAVDITAVEAAELLLFDLG